MGRDLSPCRNRQQFSGDLLAHFHTPLIERIDTPHHRLNKHFVLIHRDERSEAVRRQFVENQGGARLVTVVTLVKRQGFGLCDGGITKGQQARLRETVGDGELMLLGELGHGVGMNGLVIAPRRQNKVAGDGLGALVQQLVEGMLGIGPDAAPDHRTGILQYQLTAAGDALAIGFHLELFEVGRQMLESAVVGQDSVGADAEQVTVPDTDQSHEYR